VGTRVLPVIMFSLATVYTAANLHVLSISYVDNRGFSCGPYCYVANISHEAIGLIYKAAFRLNNWLADGVLVSFLLGPVVAQPDA